MNKRHLVKPKTLSRLIKCGYKPEDSETTYADVIDWLDYEKDLKVELHIADCDEFEEDDDEYDDEEDEIFENDEPSYVAFANIYSNYCSSRYDAYDNLFNKLIDRKILTKDR